MINPSRARNPVIRELRNNENRYVWVELKNGEKFVAWHWWPVLGGAVLRPLGEEKRHIPYREIAAVEALPSQPVRSGEARRGAIR